MTLDHLPCPFHYLHCIAVADISSSRRNSPILTLTALRSEDALDLFLPLFLPCLYLFREYGPRSFNYTAEADSQYILYVRPLT